MKNDTYQRSFRIQKTGFALLLSIGLFFMLALVSNMRSMAADEMHRDFSKTEIESIIHDYLMENPDVILNAVESHRVKQQQEKEKQVNSRIKDLLPTLTQNENSPSMGNPNAKVTVVEFFDYNCGFCKRVWPSLLRLVEERDDVRVVFKELPILNEQSITAARAALAAGKQDKYVDFHRSLMLHRGKKTEAALSVIARRVGLDIDQWRMDMNSSGVSIEIQQNQKLSQELQLRGTPAFIVGEELVPGALSYDELNAKIDEIVAQR